ncbi:MAG: TPM domain-containing protein [Bacteroidota bacterium]|nr:TPM domain-containing protein [Bacteroidota bacterium]
MASSKKFFNTKQQADIVYAIKRAELKTSGEIRVHLEDKCKDSPIERANAVFENLGMHKTELRNGILFYMAVDSKDFAVVGDKGIHEKVGAEFWDKIKDKAIDNFKQSKFAEGLEEAILECGRQLKTYFPVNRDDINELNDEITFS